MAEITVAALQLALGSDDEQTNIAAVSALVEEAAGKGAQIILPPELFSGPYFCKVEDEALFALARPLRKHPSISAETAAMFSASSAEFRASCKAATVISVMRCPYQAPRPNRSMIP